MCFDLDSQPPIHPLMSDAHGESVTLTSADGTPFAAYQVHADSARRNGAGIVILPDVRGLYRFYQDLAQRFGEAGIEAITIDYFGRTAGVSTRDDSFDYMPLVMQTKTNEVKDDVAAAIAALRSNPTPPSAIFTIGFCFGGSNSFNQAANSLGLNGVIGFYGSPTRAGRDGSPSVVDRVAAINIPVLGFFGGADPSITAEDISAFDAALNKVGVEHDLITYPGAPHSFFDRKYDEFSQESSDSWERSLAFIASHTPVA
jgi:carboxymethylenebutenolidase